MEATRYAPWVRGVMAIGWCWLATAMAARAQDVGPLLIPSANPTVAPSSLLTQSGRGAIAPLLVTNTSSSDTRVAERGSSGDEGREIDLDRKRVDVARRLSQAEQALEAVRTTGSDGAKSPAKLSQEVEILKQLDLVLGRQKAADERANELQIARTELQAKLDSLRNGGELDGPAPSFLLLDQLRDQRDAEMSRAGSYANTIAAASRVLENSRLVQKDKEAARSQAKAALEKNKDQLLGGTLAESLRTAEQETRLATESATLREKELANEKLTQEIHALQLTYLQEEVQRLQAVVQFTRDDLDDRLVEIARQEADLKQELLVATDDLAYLDGLWTDKRHTLDMSPQNPGALTEEVASLAQARQTRQQEIVSLNQRLERLVKLRNAWERRYHVTSSRPSRAELALWGDETQATIEQLKQEASIQASRAEEVRGKLQVVENKLQGAREQPADTVVHIETQRLRLQELGRICEANLASIEGTRRLHEKLLLEINHGVETAPLSERIVAAWSRVAGVWNYTLTTVDNRPITVGKVVTGLLLLVLGYMVSGWLSRMLGHRILPRLGIQGSAAFALQSLAFYCLLTTFTLFSLRLVNVPLTVFTFLGGALAIGIGFGSQNIVNNFISGLIMLAERPVRVGDVVEINGMSGAVTHIGARSTRLITGNNTEIIVPNSAFLQNHVVNWTLSNDHLRTSITVGVCYGSPTREVSRLLKRAADEHGLILANPEPLVWFTNFGEHAMEFELNFCFRLRNLIDRKRIESDVRLKVDSLFREAGISIAYPQRDVRLAMNQPVTVRVVQGPGIVAQDAAA